MWLLLATGCTRSATTPTTPTAPTGPDAPLLLDPGPPEDGVGYIPCDSVHEVRVVNQDDIDHRVDQIRFRPTLGEVRFDAWDVELPQVVRGGRDLIVPLRDAGLSPGPTAGILTVTTDVGVFEAEITGERTFGEARSDTFVVPEPQVDVILAVDQSGNMPADYAADLADGLPGWLDALSAAADWRLILVHSEDACGDGGTFQEGDRNVAQTVGDRAFGETHAFDERLLELASRALAENAPGECNDTFKREGAQLQVVVVSDEPEQSGQSWSFWLSDLRTYAPEVVVSGVVDEDRRCNGGDGGYGDAIGATGGVSVDLCDAGWSSRLDGLADAVVPIPPELPLDGGAVPESIEATVDGATVGATWDEGRGVLVLDDPLPPGTRVQVAWSVPPECPPEPR